MKFPNAAKGVKKIFTAEILNLIGTIVMVIAAIAVAIGGAGAAGAQTEEGIALALGEEARVVLETFLHACVLAEAFALAVVVLRDVGARPRAADLDAEVVVGLLGEHARARAAFEQTLCKRDAGRNAVALHLFNSHGAILANIVLIKCGLCCSRECYKR